MPGISETQGYSVNKLYWSQGAFILKGTNRQIINRFEKKVFIGALPLINLVFLPLS